MYIYNTYAPHHISLYIYNYIYMICKVGSDRWRQGSRCAMYLPSGQHAKTDAACVCDKKC